MVSLIMTSLSQHRWVQSFAGSIGRESRRVAQENERAQRLARRRIRSQLARPTKKSYRSAPQFQFLEATMSSATRFPGSIRDI
jgi:hypothetical protein